jgi:Domain of unknown function (DUF4436)
MTAEAPTTSPSAEVAEHAKSEPAPPEKPPPPPKWQKPRIAIGVGVLVVVIAAYALSLLGVHFLEKSEGPLPPLDLSQGGGDATIVQLRLEELKPVANRLSVNVLVYPGISAYDNRFDVLATDVAVRLYPTSDLGDLHYPKGKAPAQLSTTVEAHGDPGNWPFDSYVTEPISADAFVGSGEGLKKVPARVEVTGSLDGWDISVNRLKDPAALPTSRGTDTGNVVITLRRAKGPLIFDLGIILVLISLPTLALMVAVPMALGRRKFLPPFATWYAANLFAIVPLRNILPGAPPPGSWIDQAIVQWVLIALVTAMSLYIFAWVRQGD